MSKINFSVEIDIDNRDHCLAFGELFAKLGGQESTKTGAPKTGAPKTEAPKTEAPKTEAPKTEAPKTEAQKLDETVKEVKSVEEIVKEHLYETPTLEEIRKLGLDMVKADPEMKGKIGAWLKEKGFAGVPKIPEENRADYVAFLKGLK